MTSEPARRAATDASEIDETVSARKISVLSPALSSPAAQNPVFRAVRLAVLEKRSTAPIGPPGPRGPAGPQGPSGAPASDRRVGEMRNTLSALTAIMFAENGLPRFKTLAKGYNGFVQRILSYYKQPNFISPGRVMEKDVYHVAQPLQDLIRHDRSPIPRQNGSMKIFIINMRQIHRH